MRCRIGEGGGGCDQCVSSRLHNFERRSLKIKKGRLTEGECARKTDTSNGPRNTHSPVALREHHKQLGGLSATCKYQRRMVALEETGVSAVQDQPWAKTEWTKKNKKLQVLQAGPG